MSVIRRHRFDPPEEGEKFILERLPEHFLTEVEEDWAGDDPHRWRMLGMLHLSQHCRWTTRMLSATFERSPGHIARQLARVREELRTAPEQDVQEGTHVMSEPQPTRIAVLSLLFNWPSTGGGTVHTKELCEFLTRAGYRVRQLVARNLDFGVGRVDEQLPYECVPLEFGSEEWTADGIRSRFRQALAEFGPDHVIVTDSWNTKPLLCEAAVEYPYWVRIAALETICPLNNVRLLFDEFGQPAQCLLNQHDSPAHCRMCVQENGRFSGRLHVAERNLAGCQDLNYPQRLRDAFAAATGVLVVNPAIAELIRPHTRAVHVVPSGFDRSRFPDEAPPPARRAGEKLSVLFAGMVAEPMKGFSVLYEACSQLWRQRQDFELVATAGPVGQVDAFTRFVGWQSQEDLPRVMSDADIVVFPTIAQEALGRSAVEAMGCGRPVVASRIGGLPWVVDDGVTGLLFEPGDVRGLCRQLARLLDSAVLRDRMGSAGRLKFDREFTWDQIIARHYRPLLDGSEATIAGALHETVC